MKKLIVIDGNSLANRAFYAIPILSNSQGVITNAVYGFTNMLTHIIRREQPDYLAVAFDVSRKVFRHARYPEYKAQRKGMPEELRGQMDLIKEVLRAMRVAICEMEGYEGDDIIGTMVRWAEQRDISSTIVTGDKDSLQLLSERTQVYLTRRGISELDKFDPAVLRETYDLAPDQIRDLKGLMGDASDNIPGVPGVGEKTALKLLHQYGTLEEIYAHLEDFAGKKLGEKLREYRDQAFLSKELATIFCQVPLEFREEDLALRAFDVDALLEIYQRLELRALAKDLLSHAPVAQTEEEPEESEAQDGIAPGRVIQDPAELTELVRGETPCTLTLYLETDAGQGGAVTAIGLMPDLRPMLVKCGADFGAFVKPLLPWLNAENVALITDDGKKLYRALMREQLDASTPVLDVKLAAYLLDPERKDLADADTLLRGELHLDLPEEGEARMYERLKGLYRLSASVVEKLEKDGLMPLYLEVEMPLIKILAAMEHEGVAIDTACLEELGRTFSARIEKIAEALYAAAGERFNLNSSKQLGVILFEKMGLPVLKKTKTGYSTDAEVLEALAEENDFVRGVLAYRQLSKLNSTYVEGILKLRNPQTGRIHTTFQQTVTATGRLSSTEPNLQNIPVRTEEGRRIRKAFVPAKAGNVLVSADYSQIELRVLAHMSQDPVLLESFQKGEDIHRRTASEVFGVPMDAVTAEMRRNAKAVNFGIIYGQTDFGLSKELGISRKNARAYIDSYFARYSGVKRWIEQTIQDTRLSGVSTTLKGRRRYIKDIHSKNRNLRSFAERTAINTPIQGSAADIIKIAMVNVARELEAHEFKAKMLLQVHDELIFEAPPREISRLILLLHAAMEHAVSLDVPLKIDVSVGFNWHDMEQV